MKQIITQPAKEEINAAYAHYEEERRGLGEEFLEEFRAALQRMLDFPEAWGLIAKNVRLCQFNRFPYGIVYVIKDDTLYILAVMHLHRRAGYWRKRLKNLGREDNES